MANGEEAAARDCDVLIAGAGLAGLTAAFGLARAGFDVVCCGAAERDRAGADRRPARPIRRLSRRPSAYGRACGRAPRPLRALRLIDDTGALFPPRPVEFQAAEIGLDAFGWNIENDRMAEALGGRDRARLPGSSASRPGSRPTISPPTPSRRGSRTGA